MSSSDLIKAIETADPDQLAIRLAELERERSALMVLLRAARARRKREQRQAAPPPPRKEVQHAQR